MDQFRPPGWFCAGIGVLLLVLQLAVFRGECACSRDSERSSSTSVKHIRELIRNGDLKCTKLLCIVIVSYSYDLRCAARLLISTSNYVLMRTDMREKCIDESTINVKT